MKEVRSLAGLTDEQADFIAESARNARSMGKPSLLSELDFVN